MGPEIKVGERLQTKMVASTYKSSEIFAEELEDELMKFTATCEDKVEHVVEPTEEAQVNSGIEIDITEQTISGCNELVDKVGQHLVEQAEEAQVNSDIEIDIIERTISGGNEPLEPQFQQTTESSSSFDDTDSEVENTEALSDIRGDAASELDFDALHETFKMRNKKVTSHWRSFIQPLMWRCKWAELQIRKLHSQAQKYDRKIEEYSHQKQVHFPASEGIAVKSLPFTGKNDRNEVFRRKKRRSTETTVDLAEYSSHHNIFSYYENRKGVANDGFMDDKFINSANTTKKLDNEDEFLTNDGPLSLEPGTNGDNSLEHILRKIFILEPQVGNLRSRVAKINSANAGKFSSTDNLSLLLQSNSSISSPRNPTPPPHDIASQLMFERNAGDSFVPGSSITAHGEILIDNQRAKDKMTDFEEMTVRPIKKPLVVNDVLGSSAPALEEPELLKEDQSPPENSSKSKLTAPRRKRKTGKWKGAGRR